MLLFKAQLVMRRNDWHGSFGVRIDVNFEVIGVLNVVRQFDEVESERTNRFCNQVLQGMTGVYHYTIA